MKQIPINIPYIGEEEIKEVIKVLKSGYLTNKAGQGPMVREFESRFSKYIGSKYAIALNSGTAALHALLLSLDLSHSDEIIVPSFTFVATASMILHVGAKPVFVDIERDIFTLDPEKVKNAITKRTKAIIPVHLFGHPADLGPIIDIAKEKDIYVIEDACQAHGSEYMNKKTGSIADAGCFSFYPSKNMTTGEGGMITTNNEEIAEKVRIIINHGEKSVYNTVRLGHNFRMPEINAAIGKIQLKRLPDFIRKRTENANYFTKNLSEYSNIQVPVVRNWAKHCWYMYTLIYKKDNSLNRDEFIKKLNDDGISAGVYYKKPLHLMPLFKDLQINRNELEMTETFSSQVFSIPVHPRLSKNELTYILEKMIENLKNIK
ncbi:MAG: DegT/DnrJ/EryC1/StrS family aminotransferase [Candidatus Helarchaeota archaeon]